MNVQTRFSDKLEWVERNGQLVLRKAKIDPRTKTVTIFRNAIRVVAKDYELELRDVLEAAQARALGDGNWDEDEHPRDEDGKFTHSGGGSTSGNDGADAAVVGANEPELHPETIDVTGDEWNKETAIRLETEYQKAKPELESLIHKNVGEEVDTTVDEEDLNDNAPIVPDSWEMLGDQQQEDVKNKWMSNTYDDFYQSEVDNWMSNDESGAFRDALYEVSTGDDDWMRENLKSNYTFKGEDLDPQKDDDGNPVEKIPLAFSLNEVMSAVDVKVNDGDSGSKYKPYLEIEFDDGKLDAARPAGFDPDQQTLPGIDLLSASQYLTEEQRKLITTDLQNAGSDAAQELIDSGKIEPPDYLSDSVKEYQDEYWGQKEDSEKFQYAQDNTDIINEAQQEYDQYIENNGNGGSDVVAIPDTFDPLQTEGGSDYKKTHALVTFMSRERAYQLLEKRGLVKEGVDKGAYERSITATDNELWRDWKDSSAGSFGGQILQLASHEELGARYRDMPTHRDDLIKQADQKWKHLGGFAGIKAMVRAKWETSQYALDKAGIHSLPVYRGLKVVMPGDEPTQEIANGQNTPYTRFTDAKITRNGAYSTTTDRGVANGWNAGSGTKVVLRIDAPRTAVLSFPAYGINVHTEKEVVLAGTAFRNWDAWKDRAPGIGEVPIQQGKAA